MRKNNHFPSASILSKGTYDYADSHEATFIDIGDKITIQDIGKAFFSSAPKWTGYLFTLRNKLVSAIGLKTPGQATNRQQLLNSFKCEPGEQLGLFKVFDVTADEVILGEDDKHLNFRVSMLRSSSGELKTLSISTAVQFNNWMGKLYFLPVKPFHKLIVPAMLKGIVKQLEKKT